MKLLLTLWMILWASEAFAGGLLVRYRSSADLPGLALSPQGDLVRLETTDEEAALEEILEELRADPDVVHAEPDHAIEPAELPGDPFLPEVDSFYNYKVSRIVEAWDLARDCGEIVVAVIDGGVDTDHPDLKDNLWTNEGEIPGNGLDDDENAYVDDVHGFDFHENGGDVEDGFGHGTAVAGIIGAVGNNGIGLSGVCWTARLLTLKIFGDEKGDGGSLSSALAAIDYAVDHGARVLNLSWSLEGGKGSVFLKEAIQKAQAAGVVVVVAAGNHGKDLATDPVYPAAFDSPNLLTVSAHGFSGGKLDFSNYGDGIVDVAAPGIEIVTTAPGGDYVSFTGTSAAAPHVTGTVALLLSRDPGLEPAEVIALLIGEGEGPSGNLDAARALESHFSGEAPTLPETGDEPAPPSMGGCSLISRPAHG